MSATFVQGVSAASVAASPTSLTLTPASTAVGSLLIMAIAVTGTSPTITTPANWTALVPTVTDNSLARGYFVRPNNPGSITSVAVTVGGTGGGASGILLEINGIPASGQTDFANAYAGTFPDYQETGMGVSASIGEAHITFFVYGAQTISVANKAYWTAVNGTASTNGTPNAQVQAYYWINTGPYSKGATPDATLTGFCGQGTFRFPDQDAGVVFSIGRGIYSSNPGMQIGGIAPNTSTASGGFYQGSIGG